MEQFPRHMAIGMASAEGAAGWADYFCSLEDESRRRGGAVYAQIHNRARFVLRSVAVQNPQPARRLERSQLRSRNC